ncbi:hypothetical protein PIB30_102997 [Stylosanthes scabra]|uniref:Uncharacterized protein n=1 Tax=Stylosanthes scabra TaxID=79078 RepID=A0ABU6QYN9_9FABA|nr:hypothetical protein [Stylosanthes scabra]
MEGLDVKAENLISDNILAAAESKDNRSKLPFPSIIYRLLTDAKMDYMNWGLQQTNPHLTLIPGYEIPQFFKNNLEKGKRKFDGALRPCPVEGSSSKGKGVGDDDQGKKKYWGVRDKEDSDDED